MPRVTHMHLSNKCGKASLIPSILKPMLQKKLQHQLRLRRRRNRQKLSLLQVISLLGIRAQLTIGISSLLQLMASLVDMRTSMKLRVTQVVT